MHIVQALVSLNLGGSELVAVELSEFAAAAGHRVQVVLQMKMIHRAAGEQRAALHTTPPVSTSQANTRVP